MEWTRLTATFGALENRSLELSQGFNLIQAPNESGKSTWCAFLRTMLYGLPTRDRGPAADKNRYAPWSGAPMQGRMDLRLGDGRTLTVTRRTARRTSPMGVFSAVYAGTAEPAEGLDAAGCGEQLTGVPREVYERSAFITQSGMAISQSAELERRIAALITSGQEDASCTEAQDRLKRYLYQRRYNRTGLLPAAEGELAALTEQLAQSQDLQRQLVSAQTALPLLEEQEAQLEEELARWRRQAGAQALRQYEEALRLRREAAGSTARRRQRTQGLPPRAELAALKTAAGSVQANRLTGDSARRQLQLRQEESAQAQAALSAFPVFASLTGEEALRRAEEDRRRHAALLERQRRLRLLALLGLPLLLLCILFYDRSVPAALAGAAAGAALLAAGLLRSRRAAGQAQALLAAYGGDFTRRGADYAAAYDVLLACREQEEKARIRLESLSLSLRETEDRVIQAAKALSPAVCDFPGAVAVVDQALGLWARLAEAEREEALLAARCDALSSALGDAAPAPEPPPEEPEEALAARLREVRQALAQTRRRLSSAEGQLQLVGAPEELAAALEEKRRRVRTLQAEYDAAALALEALTAASAELQSRFSPELGRRAAAYFARLTGGKYRSVLLNRALEALAEEAEDPSPRPFQQLSQGAADQLYLSVRLAVCDLVLPQAQAAPLILDDALATFDDSRLAAALEVLWETAQRRQVLFFTCQSREADYLRRAHPGQFHTAVL